MEVIPSFNYVRVLAVGDLMLDRFVEGAVRRISPESPVPIVEHRETRNVPGGAANVARNIASLGGTCTLIGLVGDDVAGAELEGLLASSPQIRLVAIRDPGRVTTEKTRFVAHGQHMLRMDRETARPASPAMEAEILGHLALELPAHGVLVLSDYAKGTLTENLAIAAIAMATAAGVPVVVDPKSASFARYSGATVVTPNVGEAMLTTGQQIDDDRSADSAGRKMIAMAGLDAVLLTRAERGMSLIARDRSAIHIPATARDVFDVVGAGDTVAATLALALGARLDLESAARAANAAAGVVVGKRGTATASHAELVEAMMSGNRRALGTRAKIMDMPGACAARVEWARDGLECGFTNGCFDILHAGHVRLLEQARSRCDRLVVGLNGDASVGRLKGAGRPINPVQDRAEVLAALAAVDLVVIFDEDTPIEIITALGPDILMKGADYQTHEIVGADVVTVGGGRVETIALFDGRSTSRTIARVEERETLR